MRLGKFQNSIYSTLQLAKDTRTHFSKCFRTMGIRYSLPVFKGVFRELKQVYMEPFKSKRVTKLTKLLNYVLIKSRFYCKKALERIKREYSWAPISEWCVMDQNIFHIRVSKCFERTSLGSFYVLPKRHWQNDYEKYSDFEVIP
jgi:hypothetical protein